MLDAERTRRAIGAVIVPFGTCSEPSNVAAGGSACPLRFRCVGCDDFSTDVSYLPGLRAYLDDLLRQREKLRSMVEADDWARAEATPSDTEITRELSAVPERVSRIFRIVGLEQVFSTHLTAKAAETAWTAPAP